MKIITSALLLLSVVLTMSSCDKAKVDVNFDLNASNIYFTIDTTSTTGDVTFATTQFVSELKAKLDDHDASEDDVKSIYITAVEVNMINPGSQNFDPIDKIYSFMSANGLPELRVIYNESVPDGVTSISMNSDGNDLKEYLKQPVVNLRASGFLSSPNVERDSIQVKITFKVNAEVKP